MPRLGLLRLTKLVTIPLDWDNVCRTANHLIYLAASSSYHQSHHIRAAKDVALGEIRTRSESNS